MPSSTMIYRLMCFMPSAKSPSPGAQLDAFISAAFFSILNIDPVDFGIVIGRTESPTNLVKMQQIFKHRRDLRKAAVMKKRMPQILLK
jgi:hypothetical protein